MRLVDTNVLLYASDSGAPHHQVARAWLEEALSKAETIIVPWVVAVAFLRISTNPRYYPRPKSVVEAVSLLRVLIAARHRDGRQHRERRSPCGARVAVRRDRDQLRQRLRPLPWRPLGAPRRYAELTPSSHGQYA